MKTNSIKSIALASLLLAGASTAQELYSAKLWTIGRPWASDVNPNAWVNTDGSPKVTNQATLTIEPGETAGVWPTDVWGNINVRAANTATINGSLGGTATFTVVQKRNESSSNWTTLRDGSSEVTAGNLAYMNDGNATLLDAHLVGTEFDGGSGPVDSTRNAVIQVTGLTLPLYDVVIYLGINEGYSLGGFIDFNNGGPTAFTLPASQPSTTLDEIEAPGATGNYIKYTNVAGSSFSARIYGQGFNHLGPSGIQIRAVASTARITTFSVPGSAGVIDQNAKTISLTVPFGTNLATLAPNFTLGSGTCSQTSGAPPSPTFASANPVSYTVTDGATVNNYAVTVNVTPVSTAGDILTFNANFPGSSATITTTSSTTGTVVVRVPEGTTGTQVAGIQPSYTLSQFATCPQPTSGIPTPALSTTTPVSYIVTAQDGITTKTYSVSVTVDAPTPPFMALAGDGSTGALNVYNEADGYRFQTGNTALTVNWLGLFDAPNGGAGTVGDGLVSSHRVSIWVENGGALVAQTTVLTTDGLQGNFRGRNITPVILLPNTGYVIAADYNGTGDRLREGANPAEWNLNPQISSLAGRYGGVGGGMPPNAWSVMIGPNFGTTPPLPTTTLVIDLGTSPAGTTINGGTFIGTGPTNLPLPTLPVGSILRSIAVNAKLEATTMGSYASELAVLLDPTPGTPGGDFSVEITNGANPFGATVGLDWPISSDAGVNTMLVDSKTAANWSSVFPIDLATTGLFLGNAYIDPGNGTWSGTITLTYDLVAGSNPYATWSGGAPFGNDENGDGVKNGLAFLLGAANPNENALGRLPIPTKNATGLKLNFSVRKAANRGTATPTVQWSNDLGLTDPWTSNVAAVPASTSVVNGVVFQIDSSGALDVIEATIPSSEGANGKLFVRLLVTPAP